MSRAYSTVSSRFPSPSLLHIFIQLDHYPLITQSVSQVLPHSLGSSSAAHPLALIIGNGADIDDRSHQIINEALPSLFLSHGGHSLLQGQQVSGTEALYPLHIGYHLSTSSPASEYTRFWSSPLQ